MYFGTGLLEFILLGFFRFLDFIKFEMFAGIISSDILFIFSLFWTVIMQLDVLDVVPQVGRVHSSFLSSPQAQQFQVSFLQVQSFVFLPAQICC